MPPRAATLPLLLLQGSWAEARELAQVTRTHGSPLERHMAITVLGHLAQYQGQPAQAWAMVRELLPRGPDSEPEDSLFPYALEMLRLATRLALDTGDESTASDWLKAHEYWLAWSGSSRGKAEAGILRGTLRKLEGDLRGAAAQASTALDLASQPRQPLVLIDCHRLLGEIATAEDRFRDAEYHLHRAQGLAVACAVPYQRAQVYAWLARLYQLTDRGHLAASLLDDARGMASGLGAEPLLREIETLVASEPRSAGASALTGREAEVLKLVTEGMTDAEVADNLYISPRTVGQHLRSIYNKLGVSSRTAATRVAIEERLV